MTEMLEMQVAIGGWAEETFPHSTITSCLAHLRREVQEFAVSSTTFAHGDPEELADCFLILLHIAHKMNISLEEEALKKFRKNQLRQWGTPDADGVVEHIREETP